MMIHRTEETASSPIGQASAEIASPTHYAMADIIKCMRHSALMLWVADHDNPKFHKLNQSQAQLLTAAANDLEAREADKAA